VTAIAAFASFNMLTRTDTQKKKYFSVILHRLVK